MSTFKRLVNAVRNDPCSKGGHAVVVRGGWAYCSRPSCVHFRTPLWKAGK